MPRRIALPAPTTGPVQSLLPWSYEQPPNNQPQRARARSVPLSEVHPQVHIAHRRLGDMGLSYRMIVDHELIAVLKGRGDLHVKGACYHVKPGTLVLLEPFVPHVLLTDGVPGDHLALHFDWAPGVPDRPKPGHPRDPYRVEVQDAAALSTVMDLDDLTLSLLSESIRYHQASDRTSALRASVALQRLILHLLDRGRERNPDTVVDSAVQAALACIAKRYAEPLRLADLAAAADMKRSRFAQRFRSWSGRSPMAFVRRYRIDRACEYLHGTDTPLHVIAERCGYADAFSLSKAFRAELGMSPVEFRKQIGNSDIVTVKRPWP